jgi:hypothetical protein
MPVFPIPEQIPVEVHAPSARERHFKSEKHKPIVFDGEVFESGEGSDSAEL